MNIIAHINLTICVTTYTELLPSILISKRKDCRLVYISMVTLACGHSLELTERVFRNKIRGGRGNSRLTAGTMQAA